MVTMSAWRNNLSFVTRVAPAASAVSRDMFWLQARTFMPKARPMRATCPPILPNPTTPNMRPSSSRPTDVCQPPDRTELLSRRGNQLELRKPLKDVARQWRSLPHDTDRVERQKSLNDCVRFGNVIAEDGDCGPAGDRRPVRQTERDILIVVEDRDFQTSMLFEKTLWADPKPTRSTESSSLTVRNVFQRSKSP